jgi:hypothetical protein
MEQGNWKGMKDENREDRIRNGREWERRKNIPHTISVHQPKS